MFCFEEVSHYNRSWNEWECINSILAKRILLWNAKQYIEYKKADTSTLLINGNEHISQLSKTFSSLVWARKFTLSIRLSFFLSSFYWNSHHTNKLPINTSTLRICTTKRKINYHRQVVKWSLTVVHKGYDN